MREHESNTPVKSELYIGLDVHKDSITIAVAQGGRDGEVRLYGTITNDLRAIEKLLTRLRKAHGGNPCIEVCYSRAQRDGARQTFAKRSPKGCVAGRRSSQRGAVRVWDCAATASTGRPVSRGGSLDDTDATPPKERAADHGLFGKEPDRLIRK